MSSASELYDRLSMIDPTILRCTTETPHVDYRVVPKVTKTSLNKLRRIISLLHDWQDQYHFVLPGLPMGSPISLTIDALNASRQLGDMLERLEREYEPNEKRQ